MRGTGIYGSVGTVDDDVSLPAHNSYVVAFMVNEGKRGREVGCLTSRRGTKCNYSLNAGDSIAFRTLMPIPRNKSLGINFVVLSGC